MNKMLKTLFSKSGTFDGSGVNHEGQKFHSSLILKPHFENKGLTIDFTATGDDGTVYHKEHSILGVTPSEGLSLWVMSSNHPGIVEHQFVDGPSAEGAEWTLRFNAGNFENKNSFRETITIDLWPNGDLSYRYAWGLPGGEFAERSSTRMQPGNLRVIPEAKLKETDSGLVPEGDGWYVINAKKAQWYKNDKFGESCGFEGNKRFEQYGINIHVINPGQPNCHYHGEDDQEDFLVLNGQCKLLIEGQERLLGPWDFVHCPKWAKHVFVGYGNEPCAILMVGGRTGHGVIYPTIELARTTNSCPSHETNSPKESYAGCPPWVPTLGRWIKATDAATLDIWHVAIPVSDLEKSLGFYRETLGMVLVGRDDQSTKKQAFIATKKDGFTIELFQPKDLVGDPKRPDHLAFESNDIQALRAQIINSGIVAQEVEEFDNGVKYLGVTDPDGVRIDLFQGRKLYEAGISAT